MFSYCYNIKCKDFAFTWMDETNNENYFSSVQSSENNALMHRPIENFTGEARNKYSGGGLEGTSTYHSTAYNCNIRLSYFLHSEHCSWVYRENRPIW